MKRSDIRNMIREELINVYRGKLNEAFDDISYCKDCDFLVDDSEVLVFNSVPDFKLRQMLTTTVKL